MLLLLLKISFMITPPYLKKGDTVAIVCTARKFFPEDCVPAIHLLESWGLNVVLGNTIGLDNFQLGGSDEERAADLQEMICRTDVQAIWIARGGYGTVRVVDKVDFSPLVNQPKWVVGFSDVTVLHSHLNTLGLQTIHGIMPFTVPTAIDSAVHSLHDALFGLPITYQVAATPQNKVGASVGELVGGNLSIIYSLLGSQSSIATEGKILYIEDLDEYLYHVDRMLYNLKRNGYFEGLKGLIVGGMTDMHDNSIPFGFGVEDMILDLTKEYDFPICFHFPAGHVKDNRALRFGQKVSFSVTQEEVTLQFI